MAIDADDLELQRQAREALGEPDEGGEEDRGTPVPEPVIQKTAAELKAEQDAADAAARKAREEKLEADLARTQAQLAETSALLREQAATRGTGPTIIRETAPSVPAGPSVREQLDGLNQRFSEAAATGRLAEVALPAINQLVEERLKEERKNQPDYAEAIAESRISQFKLMQLSDPVKAKVFRKLEPYFDKAVDEVRRINPKGLADIPAADLTSTLRNTMAYAAGNMFLEAMEKQAAQGGTREVTAAPTRIDNSGSGTSTGRRKTITIADIPAATVRSGRSAGLTDPEIVAAWAEDLEDRG